MKKKFAVILGAIVITMLITQGAFAEMTGPEDGALAGPVGDEPVDVEETFNGDLEVDSDNSIIVPPGESIEDFINDLGDTYKDLVYTPVNPCRIIDTRIASGGLAGRIGPNTGKQFQVNMSNYASQGGKSGSCNIPTSFEPYAVAINVASTDQTGTGHVRVIPTGGGVPTAAVLNYKAGTNISNAVIAQCGSAAADDLYIYSGVAATHVVVDIMGYFAAPETTQPDQTIVVSSYVSCPNNGNCTALSPTCPSGYRLASGGIQWQTFANGQNNSYDAPWGTGTQWGCQVKNSVGSTQLFRCYGVCLRIPGR